MATTQQPVLLELPHLPNIAWFNNFLKHETVFIEAHENFIKSSYRNRCEIAGAGGKMALSIPVKGGRDHRQLYKEVEIAYDDNWQHRHWQSILSAYGSTPFFAFYAERLQQFYEVPAPLLFNFNLQLLQLLLSFLKIKKEIQFTEVYEKQPDKLDLRTGRIATAKELPTLPRYYQVFEQHHGFIPNLSIIDVLFHEGPATLQYLNIIP